MKHVAPLRYDVIFKKAFSDPAIFTAFAKDILQIELEVTAVDRDKRLEFPDEDGTVVLYAQFDVYGEDPENRAIVAIQKKHWFDYYDKFFIHQCMAILEQASRTEIPRPNLRVFTIVVITSDDERKHDIAIVDFNPKDRNGRSLNEIDHKIIFLCPECVNDDTPPPIREWLEAIQDTFDEEVDEMRYKDTIQDMFKRIAFDTITPQERAQMQNNPPA